ncbi:MAG: radical SAM protein [Planctomycetota bacterium]|nr:radical SAM protein [Planctomycetota bacterium]
MKVFLIYVRDEDFYQILPERLAGNGGDRLKVMAFPPIGIETLAPVLREHGHDVRMFDTCHPEMREPQIAQAVLDEKPDVIALSFLSTTSYLTLKSMAKLLKTTAPEIPIITGGVFATMNAPEILRDCSYIDCVGAGEGEELLPDYLENLEHPGVIAGLSWRRGDEVVQNPPRPIIKDLSKFPYADRKSLKIDFIESMPLDVPAVLSLDRFCTMQTSRGCPFPCVYCDIPALADGKWRHRSSEHVLGEMQQLNDEGYRSIYLTDDHFLLKRKRINEICQGIIDRKLEFRWGCEGRVDSVAVDQFPIMGKANCEMLAFGIESGSQKVLDRLKKMQNLAQIENAVNEAKKYGIGMAHGFFLVGSPDETVEEIIESFRFAAKLKLDTFGFNRLCVYRGTPLWQEYIRRGIIDDKRDWYKWFKCSDVDPTVLPGEVINAARQKGYLLLFAHRAFRRPIQTFKLLRRFSRYMKFSDIVKLLWSPFRKRVLTRKPELPAKMIDEGLEAPIRDLVSVSD